MILRPTVLILGAGASYPYGYPLGGELVSRIVDLTRTGSGLGAALPHHLNMRAFNTRLDGSGVSSIDDFLESNPDFRDLGKLCIAAALTIGGPTQDHKPNPNSDWYKYLWGRLHEGAATSADFRRNRLKIVTYNYETSLERYLLGVLAQLYPDLAQADEAKVIALLSEVLPVVHLHGTLSGTDGTVQRESDRRRFMDRAFLEHAATGIRIVHEDESKEYQKAHDWLQEAEVVHLLGFGYHPTNVRRLDLASQSGKRTQGWLHFGGTAFQMQAAEIDRAQRDMQMGGSVLRTAQCVEYLRSYAFLE